MSGRRRLVVLRHGQTAHNAAGIWQGQLDSPLSDVGLAQAEAVAGVLAALEPTAVVSSDLQRARVTGEHVARRCGIELTTDQRLREIHAGVWQGRSSEEVVAEFPTEWAAIAAGEDVRRGGPTGETMAEVMVRATAAAGDVAAAMAPGECVVLSTHGGAGKVLVGGLLGLDLSTTARVLGGLGNAHFGLLEEGRRGWFVREWNISSGVPSAGGGRFGLTGGVR